MQLAMVVVSIESDDDQIHLWLASWGLPASVEHLMVVSKLLLCHLHNQQLVAFYAGSAAQLAAVASASGPEKENLAEGASAMVTAALRLQPLLARAQKLRTRDQALSVTCAKDITGESPVNRLSSCNLAIVM